MKDEIRDDSHYITKTQLAARASVSVRTIDAWMAKRLVPFRKIGRTVRFNWSEVQEHWSARNRPAIADPNRQPRSGIAGLLRERAAEIRKAEAQRLEAP
jgi:excisionase family DNA binding protein